jgi:chemosensory pili system protein ChpC
MSTAIAKEMDCAVIPIHQTSLLVPNVCIAEITPWRRLRPKPDTPSWHLGTLAWRGTQVPVVSYEILNDAPELVLPPNEPGACLIIMNRSRPATELTFYGLAAQGLPRLLHVADDELAQQGAAQHSAEAYRVHLGTEDAIVPKLSMVEGLIVELVA